MVSSSLRSSRTYTVVVPACDSRILGALIKMTDAKVFTLATLDRMVDYTRLQEFLPTQKDSYGP